ncbi:cardiolipin synthase [Deminuibacter soli]|nr:cardiolipin synthase [Deminuibacter soli]
MTLHSIDILSWIITASYVVSTVFAVIIISQNRAPSKTIAYLLLFYSLPVLGIVIYAVAGENYRKNKLYKRKFLQDNAQFNLYASHLIRLSEDLLGQHLKELKGSEQTARLILNDSRLPLSVNNRVELLINGEQKFERMFAELEKAQHHIHIEYYIIENGVIADRLLKLLVKKAAEGVAVKMIYDDFGTSLKNRYLRKLRTQGVKAFPFYRILFPLVSNRHNYRDHRKMIIIDGRLAFTGGINISDRYDNNLPGNDLYWRDTHLLIEGDAVKPLQYLFFLNWNFCSDEELPVSLDYFPSDKTGHNQLVQVIQSGPDSDRASIMLSYFSAIVNAKKYVYITTPYFIPNESLRNALREAALSKVEVRLLVPGVSDSRFVNLAAHSYYEELLEAGVRIYLYQKGFVHAKTLVSDNTLSMVGSANMDIRSFDLNFELNAVVYDSLIHDQLKAVFLKDLEDSVEITLAEWSQRSRVKKFCESICRLFSSVL